MQHSNGLRSLLAAAFVMIAGTVAHANEASCRASCYSYSNDPNMCLMSCTAVYGTDTPVSFSAIFVSPSTGYSGMSWHHPNLGMARRIARAYCERESGKGDCREAVWADRRCVALAVGSGGAWGADLSMSRRDAEAKALHRCRAGGATCAVTQWHCPG